MATAIANAESRADFRLTRASRRERLTTRGDESSATFTTARSSAWSRSGSRLRAAQAEVPRSLGELGADLSRVADGLASVQDELREFARGIHPAILAEGGLGPALKTLARRSTVPVRLDVHAHARLPERVEVATYYVVSEALTNAAKHAHASVVHIEVQAVDRMLRLRVSDDGAGGADAIRGSGLVGLKDRVEAVGGAFSVHSPIGAGTSLDVGFPAGRLIGTRQARAASLRDRLEGWQSGSNAAVLKTVRRAIPVSGVRIPPFRNVVSRDMLDACLGVMSVCQVSFGRSASKRISEQRGRFCGWGTINPSRLRIRQIVALDGIPSMRPARW